jgi:hypothetical protein
MNPTVYLAEDITVNTVFRSLDSMLFKCAGRE